MFMLKHKVLSISLLLCLGLYSCEQEKDLYYERPSTLEGTIYEQLKKDGRFELYLQAVDKVPSAERLKHTGSFTVFPPTDDAFYKFLGEQDKDFADLSDEELAAIVEYSYTDFALPRKFLTTRSEWGYWVDKNDAYKKKTKYIRPAYDEKGYRIINEPKYIPIFSNEYFAAVGGSGEEEATYTFFYPTTAWNKSGFGFNVASANVVENKEMTANNGFIYPVDAVLLPSNNIIEELQTSNKSQVFTSLFENFVEYVYSEYETDKQQSPVDLYYKRYQGSKPQELSSPVAELDIDVNSENINSSYSEQAPQYSSHVVFAPTNEAINRHLAKYNGAPSRPALRYLLNAHFIKDIIQYPYQLNKEGNPYNYLFEQGLIIDQKVVSNGLIYYIDGVIEPDLFSSVVAPVFLNEKYSMQMYALEKSGQTLQLADLSSAFRLLILDNSYFEDRNITYEPSTDTFLKDGKVWNVNSDDPLAMSKDSVVALINRTIVKGELKGGYGKMSSGAYVYFDDKNGKIISDGVELSYTEHYVNSNGNSYVVGDLFGSQEDYAPFLKREYSKFHNLLNLANMYIYPDYTAFILPDRLIEYGSYPFEMVMENGKLDSSYPNAQRVLMDRLKAYIVPDVLFTTDNNAYGSHSTSLDGIKISFAPDYVVDPLDNVIKIIRSNITKNGITLHEIDSIIRY